MQSFFKNEEGASWRKALADEFKARRRKQDEEAKAGALFPLVAMPFGEEEIMAMAEVLLSGRLTMGANVEEAERVFATTVGAPFAVMVNSGSSANLLAVAAITNKLRKIRCDAGDEVLVPAVCWSTSVHPLIQAGLRPVFVDADPQTFNVTLDQLEAKMNPRVKAVMAVHVLGNCISMKDLEGFVKKHRLILIEDTCEALGSYYNSSTGAGSEKRMLGTLGDFGTFSFFFSHHLTSGEGGMIVCKTEQDYNILRSLRAHGWTRNLTNRAEVEAHYPDIDPRFVFINVGYNLRPMEMQGAMLRVQLGKLHAFNACRRDNMARVHARLNRDPRFGKLMALMSPSVGSDPAWFGIGALLHQPFAHQLREYLVYLEKHGIENRPIISGNFIRQPCISSYCENERPENYLGAEAIHTRGFFIGVHQVAISDETIDKLVDIMLSFPFVGQHVTLVTGSSGMVGMHLRELVETRPHQRIDSQTVVDTQTNSKWIFITRRDGDLREVEQVRDIFKRFTPTRVLHCAAKLQSASEMTKRPVEFWLDNVAINNNVLSVAHEGRKRTGPVKVVSVLSTVMFPDGSPTVEPPYRVDQIHSGPPSSTSESYALAKRALDKLTKWYRSEYSANFVTILPGNIYGAHGDFEPKTAPLVNALIAKVESARNSNQSTLKMVGTGKPERQVMWAGDLARVLFWALDHLDQAEPLIVAGPELSIADIAKLTCDVTGFTGTLEFEINGMDGPRKRTADTSQFTEIYPRFDMLPLREGIGRTLEWYRREGSANSKMPSKL